MPGGLAEHSPHAILANVTGARKGVLFDGWLDDRYVRTLFDALERESPCDQARDGSRDQDADVCGKTKRRGRGPVDRA
jgi:hypothetical protein